MASSIRSLLFSDIEGSTELLRRAGPRYPEVLKLHRRIVRDELAAAGGTEHGTEGDSFFLSFDSAAAALTAALRIQCTLESTPWPDGLRLRVRMGVHLGEVIDDGGDLFGIAIHHAARLADCAHGGQIVVSEAMRATVTRLPDEVELVALGAHRLDDIGTIDVFQVVHPQLQHTFPALRRVSGDATNLPRTPTAFVGGRDEIDELRQLCERSPLVTLTGPGGVGKTRRAIELGRSCIEQFDRGVWMVELAQVRDVDAVLPTIAATLSIGPQPDATLLESMVDWCRGRQLMLIVDNCEHLLEPVRELARVIVAQCPTITLVASSRQPLGVAGERVHAVQVLNPEVDGVALFLDRASAADSSFVLGDDERPMVVEICRHLDGLPLAIELAAARVRSMAPADLLKRLDDRFRLLRGGTSESDRHATVRATVAWSYQLLTDHERLVFDRASVFAGGFDLEAAEAICTHDDLDQFEIIDLLGNLVDKSMVVADRQPGGARYRLLETLQQFGHDNLVAAHALGQVRARHMRHYVEVAEAADLLFRGAMEVTGAAILEREWDNLRVAHGWAVQTTDLEVAERIVAATRMFAVNRNRLEQGDWVERTIALGTDQRQPASDTFAQGAYWAYMDEDKDRLFERLERGIELLDELDGPEAALCLSFVLPDRLSRVPDPDALLETAASKLDCDRDWWVLIALEEAAARGGTLSRDRYRDLLATTAERVRAPSLLVAAGLVQGHDALLGPTPDPPAALEHYRRSALIARDSGSDTSEGDCLRSIATVIAATDPAGAVEACRDALRKNYDIRNWHRVWQLFESVTMCFAAAGNDEASARTFGYLEAHWQPFGIEDQLGFRTEMRRAMASRPALEPARHRGAAMNRYEIVEDALAELQQMIDH